MRMSEVTEKHRQQYRQIREALQTFFHYEIVLSILKTTKNGMKQSRHTCTRVFG